MVRLDGKIAIVTGGARGIGEAISRLFVEEGARVVLTDVLEEDGQKTAESIGDNAKFTKQDVTDEAGWSQVLEETEQAFGTPDILVNNAGILLFKALTDLTADEMRKIIDVNLIGTMLGTQVIGRAMIANGKGSIINLSSADGLAGANSVSAYVASKWAVRGFTKSAALEFGHQGVRVNSIHPGGVITPMTNPMGAEKEDFDKAFKVYAAQRGCNPEEIAHGALYLASDDSLYCMGTELAIDGGLTAGHYYAGLPGAPPAYQG